MNRTEHELELMRRYLDGVASLAETQELEALIVKDASMRQDFLRYTHLDSALAGVRRSQPSVAAPRRSVWRSWRPLAAAAAVLVLFVGSWLLLERGKKDGFIARVIRIDGELRTQSGRRFSVGDRLAAGETLTMSAGQAELAFFETGVHVLASAPLTLVAQDRQSVFLREGELKLVVPPQGAGFVVETTERKITDLGTSFVVTAQSTGSRILVLDGEIMVDARDGKGGQMMIEGNQADFDRSGAAVLRSGQGSGLPELPEALVDGSQSPLRGKIFAYAANAVLPKTNRNAEISAAPFLQLIRSGFRDRSGVEKMIQSGPLEFFGIAGSYGEYPERHGLSSYAERVGWVAWFQGKVVAPKPGRYRFWGYADNHLLVAINGKPVFEGSRNDSSFYRDLKIERLDHPALPCLNAHSGFASGSWIEVGTDPVHIDILFGETSGHLTSGLLLIEREGDAYEQTFWRQPRWPLFLTESPTKTQVSNLENLRGKMEEKLMGSFSIPTSDIWRVVPSD